MADRTGIEWTDATWNPVTGCTEVSPGCDRCYAKTFAERWRGVRGHHFERGFDVQLRPDRLTFPLRLRKPRRIFVNSMSDLFHKDVPDEFIARVFAVMCATKRRHTYQVLTKRHGRMRSLLDNDEFANHVLTLADEMAPPQVAELACGDTWPLPNVWLGVSVETQQWADIRVPALVQTPAAVRFVSCEPLLGAVNLTPWLVCDLSEDGTSMPHRCDCCDRLNWVIVGGESGHGARPMHPEWLRGLRDQCVGAGVPFLFKQWGEWAPTSGVWGGRDHVMVFDGRHVPASQWPDDELLTVLVRNPRTGRVCPICTAPQTMTRLGKHKAGRVLDGRAWDQFPTQPTTTGGAV